MKRASCVLHFLSKDLVIYDFWSYVFPRDYQFLKNDLKYYVVRSDAEISEYVEFLSH
jgi:hypothetical protein